ncbi:glucokinase [Massilia sp. W12]|uniref:glucokinase n=1 Tax=Massilia sp. W12 TaxID=3126507 RepID=UPI0030D28FCA
MEALPQTSQEYGPRLLADIGGTNARFALEFAPLQYEEVQVLPCADYPSLAQAMRAYLQRMHVRLAGRSLRHAAIAIANPVDGDAVRMTNHHWAFSIAALKAEMGFDTLLVVNDFTALARALPHLSAAQLQQVGGGAPRAGGVLGLIGAGTGLGVSGMIPAGQRWIALQSEGGHVSFAPADEREIAILRFAWREFPHVSAERLLSGVGLELIWRALADWRGVSFQSAPAAPHITAAALDGSCAISVETVDAFCAMLGTIAANIAITLGAQGGIYIGGGIVPRLGERFAQSAFRQRFEHKGRFSNWLAQVPTWVITAPYPAFLGVSVMLEEVLGEG